MHDIERHLTFCTFLLIVTVLLLAPSAGLMTLPIPDDQPDQATLAVLPDYSHVDKEWQNKVSRTHTSSALTSLSYYVYPHFFAAQISISAGTAAVAIQRYMYKGRGPPSA